ncbi:MATE family efflux transporter [Murimonas intestini]|uniref:Multidrug export protein MepA n=1 Tax=Murimonas intestini TaxID=1337051 RepID=A0AB73T7T2_9FIRM|nr:MATE family efflux transporter [Murimonas intestini]MCR1839691.1 MATE family efflux transporter [Murimonas intestini]MCR1866534.1 MATE family efflux transporter [Murimonas intestini]MCR1884842.1 MATE family efflux transporter [Murimonas intestini]
MEKENRLGTEDVRKLVLSLAIPSMLAQFINVLYSVVDRMYIGNIAETGEMALAGVGVCGPLIALISAFASFIGVGGSPLMSIRLGEQKIERARQILANSFLMLSVISVGTTGIIFLVKDKLLMAFGASAATFTYADDYFTIYLLGTIFALLSIGMNQFIIAQGYAKTAMASVVIGAVLNLALDPLFIFVFGMGVKGAAYATVFSQFVSCVYVLLVLFGKKIPVRITFKGYSWSVMKQIAFLGFTPFIIIVMDNVILLALNATLQGYGGAGRGDMLVTCSTIVQSFMLIVTMPLGGITSGTQTILGYNYGARRSGRVRSAEKYIVLLCLAFTTVMFIAAQTCSGYFVRIFTKNEEYISFASQAIKIYTLGIMPLAFQYAFVDGFTGMGIAKLAIPLSMMRKVIFLAGVFLIPVFSVIENIFYAEPLTDFISAIITSACYFIMIGKVLRQRELLQEGRA